MSSENSAPTEWLRTARVRVVEDDAGLTRLRLQGMSPLMTCVATLAVAVVVCGFASPLAAMVFSPKPVPVLLIAITAVALILVATLLALRRKHAIETGREDLVIDDVARSLSLPWNFGRSRETRIGYEQVTAIAPASEHGAELPGMDMHALGTKSYRKMEASPDDFVPEMGHRGEMHYAVIVCWRIDEDGPEVISPIVRWSEMKRAMALTFWLRRRLGLPVSDEQVNPRDHAPP